MKRKSLLILTSVMLHLLVVDLTFYWITSGNSSSILVLSAYNLIWIFLGGTVGIHSYNENREIQKKGSL